MEVRQLANPGFLVALGVLGGGAAGMKGAIEAFSIVLHKQPIYAQDKRALRAIPTETRHWVRLGQDLLVAPEELPVLGTENYLTRLYVEKHPPPGSRPRVIELHAAYYTGMIDTVPHIPERCYVGAGQALVGGPWIVPVPLDTSTWRPADDLPPALQGRVYTVRLSHEYSTAGPGRRVPLPIDLTPDRPLRLRVSEYVFQAPAATGGAGVRRLAGYFFVANGGWSSSAEQVRELAFRRENVYAYYLKVQFASHDVQTPEELAALAGSLLDDLFGELMACVPDWVKVERGEWPPRASPGSARGRETAQAPGSR